MFGGKLLVAFPKGQRLRGLHKTAGAVGKFLEIHSQLLRPIRRRKIPGPDQAARFQHYVGVFYCSLKGLFACCTSALMPFWGCCQNGDKSMTSEAGSIRAIYRYPVKGLSPQALDRTPLSIGLTIPADRLYAIENGPSGFDADTPAYFPKQRFIMLMRNERLASLRTDFDEVSHTLTIES